MELHWRDAFVVIVDVDSGDEELDASSVGRVQVALSASLRTTDIAIVLWGRISTLSHVDAHWAAGRRQLDHGRRRSDERLRRQVPLLGSVTVRRRRVSRKPGSEAVQRDTEPLSRKRAEAGRTSGREGRRRRARHQQVVGIVVVEVVRVWNDVGAGQYEAECVDGAVCIRQ